MIVNLGLDGGRQARVLTLIKRLRIVARTGIERTKTIRAQLASKRKHVDAAQQALNPAFLVGHPDERRPAIWAVQFSHEP